MNDKVIKLLSISFEIKYDNNNKYLNDSRIQINWSFDKIMSLYANDITN